MMMEEKEMAVVNKADVPSHSDTLLAAVGASLGSRKRVERREREREWKASGRRNSVVVVVVR